MTDYSSIVSLFPPEPEVAAARVAQAGSPEKAAAAVPIARQLNIPPVLVESDPQFWGEQARLQGARQAIGTVPLLAPWLAADPANAKLASDDLPQLAKVAPTIPESAPVGTFADSIARGWSATEHNRAVADAALGIGPTPPPLPPVPPTEPGILPYLRETFGSFIGSMGSTLAHAAPVAAAGAAIGAATGPGALVTGGAGLLYGIAADMALTAGGAAYEQAGTYRDGDGNPLPEGARKFAAVAAGTGTAALTMLLPGVGKPALEAGKALIADTIAQAVPQVAAEIGKAGLKGGLLNMAFTAVQSIPIELARLGEPGFDNLVSDPQARADFVERHVQAFVDGVLLFGALGVPSALVHPLGAIITARSDAARLDTLVEAAQDSKLKQRSATVFGDFIRSGNKDDIGISPTADPAALAKIASPEAIQRAAETGGDVHIPLSEYAAKVDPATHAALRDDIRMSPDGMTLREAAEAERPPVTPEGEAAGRIDPYADMRRLGILDEDTPLGQQSAASQSAILERVGLKEGVYVRPSEELAKREGYDPDTKVLVSDMTPRELAESPDAAHNRPTAAAERPPVPGETLTMAEAQPGAALLPRPGESPVEVARRVLYLEPLLKEPLPGMTQASFERYSRLLEAQAARAAEVPEPLPSAREAAEAKVDQRRDVRAFQTIAASEDLKLDPAAVGDELAHGIVSTQFGTKLDPALLREGGMHPDDIAGSLGYRSGAELVRDLMKVDREALVQKEIDRTAAGALLNRVLNSKQLDVLIAETRALGGPPMTREALRDSVGQRFDTLTVKEAQKPALPVVVRAGLAAESALLKGDVAAALRAKQQQAVAFEMARLQKTFQPELNSYDRLANRYASRKIVANRDPEYTNHIQALLGLLGRSLARDRAELVRSLEASPSGQDLGAFIRDRTAAGRIISDPAGLPMGKPFDQWTVGEFRQLANVIKTLDHNAMEENHVGRAEARMNLDAVAEDIRHELADRIERIDPFNDTPLVKWAGRNFDARYLKIERLFDWIDRNNPFGALNTYVFRRVKEGQFAADDMRREATAALKKINDRQMRRRLTERVDNPLIDVDGRPMRLTRANVIAMALNMGNRSNFDKLTRGFKWDPDTVADLVRRTLTKREWDFVQGLWDVFQRFQDRADDVVRRTSGVGMDLIEARPVDTPFGQVRGGYWPVEYDPLRSNIAEIKEGDLFKRTGWFNPLPPAGYAKTRTGVAKPLRLDLDFIGNRLSEMIHDIAYREALTDANKVLSNRAVRDAITRSYGPEYTAQLKPWLQDIANRRQTDDRGQGWINSLSREARLNANVLMLGLKPPTAIIHGVSALSNSIRETGPVYFGQAVASFFRNPDGMRAQWRWAHEMSGEVRDRGRGFDRDVRAMVQELSATRSPLGLASVRQHFAVFAMSFIGALDKLSAVPAWIAGYKKGLDLGMSDEDAVYYADKVLRNAHGAGGAPDLPQLMRSSEVMQWFTMFMTYFNHNYNQSRDIGREVPAGYQAVKIGDLRAGTGHFVSLMGGVLAYLIIPGLVHKLIKGGGPSAQGEGPVEWFTEALGEQVLSQIPLIRDIANAATHNRPIEVASPLSSLFRDMTASVVDLAHKVGVAQGPVSQQWFKHLWETPAALIGVGPPEQLAGALQFLYDLHTHRQYANDPVAWKNGLIYGKSHPQPRH